MRIAKFAGRYDLPGSPQDVHVIPISGGHDSACLAIVMHHLFPNVDFRLLFTDTRAEASVLYEYLDRIEEYLGKPIERHVPEKGLMELIREWNGFLPSHKDRYCTRALKLEPFEKIMEDYRKVSASGTIHSYVGIRADEDRTGLVSHKDWILTHTPFLDMGIRREDVYAILGETVGMNPVYRYRTRSGCVTCYFQSKRELIGAMELHPEEFLEGESVEKLSRTDEKRYEIVSRDLASVHTNYPIAPRVDVRSRETAKEVTWLPVRRKSSETLSLFGERTDLFAAVEMFIHPGVGDHGVWWQNFVTDSTTRAGLVRQLEMHYRHRLQTAEVFFLTEEEMSQELNLIMYHIQAPSDKVVLDRPDDESYTWHGDFAYRQLRHIVAYIKDLLEISAIEQEIRELLSAPEGSWGYKRRQGLEQRLKKIKHPGGEILAMDRYEPQGQDIETPERLVACFACQI